VQEITTWIEKKDLVMDLTITYSGNAMMKVSFDERVISVPVTVENVSITSAKMRIVLKNWTKHLPIISGLHFAFLEPPNINFHISNIPGRVSIIHIFIRMIFWENHSLLAYCYSTLRDFMKKFDLKKSCLKKISKKKIRKFSVKFNYFFWLSVFCSQFGVCLQKIWGV
jgi:hypothetical protein